MEQQDESAGVSRGQNQHHVLPEDGAAAATAIAPLLDRLDARTDAPQMLILTSDDEAAVTTAAHLGTQAPALRIIATTEARRAQRVLRGRTAHVIAATPDTLAALIRGAALKLDAVRVVVLAWVESPAQQGALEAVMADVPKDAARIVIGAAVTPAVEQLLERYAWRARRVQPAMAETLPPASLSYVATSAAGRPAALRRLLDALDPESAFVVVQEAGARAATEASLRTLGYGPDASGAVALGAEPAGAPALVVLYDLPRDEAALRTIARDHGAARLVALVTPRQLASLRQLAGGSVTPLTLPDAAVRARAREERMRDELREALDAGQFARELLALEPLLTEYDGVEVAAAALRLLDAERTRARTPQMSSQPSAVTRLYLNVGSMDDVGPGDLMGAIINGAGISKAELGRVDVRERHSTVEVAASVANAVVDKLTGAQIRGRRVIAKVDADKPRERPRRPGGDRGDRGDRGERRGPPRRERPPRR